MADVTGPISSLPGARHAVPKGCKCDDHPDRDAVARVQGETDSFGSEMHDMCSECYEAYKEEVRNEDTSGRCDYCKNDVAARSPMRDYEEGLAGPVYYVCETCRKRVEDRLREELDAFDHDGYEGPDDVDYEEPDVDYAPELEPEEVLLRGPR